MTCRTGVLFFMAVIVGLSACGGRDGRIEITIAPSPEMLGDVTSFAASMDIAVSGAEEGKQSYHAREDGQTKLFVDGSERVYFIPRPEAQGSVRIDVVVRDTRLPIATGYAELPLLRGKGAAVRVTVLRPGRCDNEFKDTDEGDVDCGGSCTRRCGLGRGCNMDGDCAEGGCVRGQCAAAACSNGALDGDETSIDCGGSCPGCLNGEACVNAGDCLSAYCSAAHKCEPCSQSSQCTDGGECVDGRCQTQRTRNCTVPNGSGTQELMGTTWGLCMARSCDPGYHLSNGMCESDTRPCVVGGGSGVQTWTGSDFGPCMATGCPSGQHMENNVCTNDTKTCTVANGMGTQTWSGSGYGACMPTSCNAGYHIEGNGCISDKPTVTGFAPSTAPSAGVMWACGCQTLTLNGTGFTPNTTVTLVGQQERSVATTYLSPTQVSFSHCTTEPAWSAIGNYTVYATVLGQGDTNSITLSVQQSKPILISYMPFETYQNVPYCPTFNLRSFAGLCPGAEWRAYIAGSTGSPMGSFPLTVSSSSPQTATNPGGTGCYILSNGDPGPTYDVSVRNLDGGESTRGSVTLAN